MADRRASLKSKRKYLVLVLLAVISSVAFDQMTKLAAERHLMIWSDETDSTSYQGRRLAIWSIGEMEGPGEEASSYLALNINYVRNMGAAWGILSDLPSNVRGPFFFLVTVIAMVMIGIYFRSTPESHRLTRWGLLLILSGALGNFINRLSRGYVIDWIDVQWNLLGWRYAFPNFNWADICITIGVLMLMIEMLVLEKLKRRDSVRALVSN